MRQSKYLADSAIYMSDPKIFYCSIEKFTPVPLLDRSVRIDQHECLVDIDIRKLLHDSDIYTIGPKIVRCSIEKSTPVPLLDRSVQIDQHESLVDNDIRKQLQDSVR